MEKLVSLNTKISAEDKEAFVAIAESLGMTPSAVIKVFVRKFNECGGFPFEVRRSPKFSLKGQTFEVTRSRNGVINPPEPKRDDDDKDDVDY